MQRKAELRRKATAIIAQEARHLAYTADYAEGGVVHTDEEEEFLREELDRQGDAIDKLSGSL